MATRTDGPISSNVPAASNDGVVLSAAVGREDVGVDVMGVRPPPQAATHPSVTMIVDATRARTAGARLLKARSPGWAPVLVESSLGGIGIIHRVELVGDDFVLQNRHLPSIAAGDRCTGLGERLSNGSPATGHRPKLPTLVAIIGNRRVLRCGCTAGSKSTMPVAVATKS